MDTTKLFTQIKSGARIIKQFKNPLFEVSLKETNILSVDLFPTRYDKEEVELVIDNMKFLAQKNKYLILVNSGPMASITFDGLRVLAKHDSFSYAIAKAYVINTFSQRLMANFYMRYFKPRIPIKFFSSKMEAEVWLLKNFRGFFSDKKYSALGKPVMA